MANLQTEIANGQANSGLPFQRLADQDDIEVDTDLNLTFASSDLPVWQQSAIKKIERLVGKNQLRKRYKQFLETNKTRDTFWEDVMNALELSVSIRGNPMAEIPATGPLVIVANHPFGLIDGAAVCWSVAQRRKDFKVILWDVFYANTHGRPYLLPLDLSEDSTEARRQNLQIRRQAASYLKQGHAIVLFPSGSTERAKSLLSPPEELPWYPFTSKLVKQTDATVLPIFVHGHNSKLFHWSSSVSEILRRALFFHEINRGIGSTVDLTIGSRLPASILSSRQPHQQCSDLLRNATLALENCCSEEDSRMIKNFSKTRC